MARQPAKEERPRSPAQRSPLHRPLFGLAMLLLLGLKFALPCATEINSGLASLVTIGLRWLTEAIPLAITALLLACLAYFVRNVLA